MDLIETLGLAINLYREYVLLREYWRLLKISCQLLRSLHSNIKNFRLGSSNNASTSMNNLSANHQKKVVKFIERNGNSLDCFSKKTVIEENVQSKVKESRDQDFQAGKVTSEERDKQNKANEILNDFLATKSVTEKQSSNSGSEKEVEAENVCISLANNIQDQKKSKEPENNCTSYASTSSTNCVQSYIDKYFTKVAKSLENDKNLSHQGNCLSGVSHSTDFNGSQNQPEVPRVGTVDDKDHNLVTGSRGLKLKSVHFIGLGSTQTDFINPETKILDKNVCCKNKQGLTTAHRDCVVHDIVSKKEVNSNRNIVIQFFKSNRSEKCSRKRKYIEELLEIDENSPSAPLDLSTPREKRRKFEDKHLIVRRSRRFLSKKE